MELYNNTLIPSNIAPIFVLLTSLAKLLHYDESEESLSHLRKKILSLLGPSCAAV